MAADTGLVECTPQLADVLNDGIAHHLGGRFAQAAACYSRALELDAQSNDAWRLLGVIALQTGDHPAARAHFERAIGIAPHDADAHSALGNVHELEDRYPEAHAAYAAAHALDGKHAAAATGLVRTTLRLGRAAEAIALAETAIARGLQDAGLLRSLGAARLERRAYAGAADACRASIATEPHADAYANLSAASVHLHRVRDAIDAALAALALDPAHAQAANNLGIALKANDDLPAALAAFERAIALGAEDAHLNLGTTRLLVGDYRGGWPEYGWVTAERRANPLAHSLPMWDGTPVPGGRLLIWPEQGVGDTIQLARFAAPARALVGSVTLACPPGTLDVLRTVPGVDACIDSAAPPPVDAFDRWLPSIRLPVVLDIDPRRIPGDAYLRADPVRIERYRARLATRAKLRVGLVWSGSPEFIWNGIRSIRLDALAALGRIPDVAWFALQQGAAKSEALRGALPLDPINADIVDFADTAAIIAQLDLVISVDTSVAHLAGALGTPLWVLLSRRPDWRWRLAGDTTPWYPAARLFRQGDDGAWEPVVAAVAAALFSLVESRAPAEGCRG